MNTDKIFAQIRSQLEGGGVWVDRDTSTPDDGLKLGLKAAGAERPLYVAAIVAMLISDDVRHRTGAVAVIPEIRAEVGAERLAKIVRDHEALYQGVAPSWRISHDDLEQAAALAIAPEVSTKDAAALAWLKQLAQDRPWGAFLLNDLARADGAWLVKNAKGLVPHTHIGVLLKLSSAQRDDLIDALAPWPAEKPTVLTASVWKQLPADEASRLRQKMWPGSAP